MIGVVAVVSIFVPADLALATRKDLTTTGFVILVLLTPSVLQFQVEAVEGLMVGLLVQLPSHRSRFSSCLRLLRLFPA